MNLLHPTIAAVTARIIQRSAPSRAAYLAQIRAASTVTPARARLSCGNLAHGFAACGTQDKATLKAVNAPNLGIVSAYNDMLSAHQPFEHYPAIIRAAARAMGATAQVAGGVPAMCDGVTQGRPGMELSLFSRDVIAQASAVALSHDMFDAAVYLGVCDKIVPGLLIGALAFGHLPAVFIPAGPMPSGIPNKEKAAVRERYAAGLASREELLAAEAASYHAPGTCTFYGTANSNQVLLEAMGLQLPGTSFVPPGTELRDALTAASAQRALQLAATGDDYRPIGELVNEQAIVNAIVALMATGGSTNHTIHWIAVARAAGIVLDWEDMDAISSVVPTLSHVYPNGQADVNHFAAAGGTALVFAELLKAGLMHGDIRTIAPGGIGDYCQEPRLDGERLHWVAGATTSADTSVLRPVADPFEAHGGLRLLRGNLGQGLIKLSAVQPEHRAITAPAVVVDTPAALNRLHAAGALPHDFVAVVRVQGPQANGMPVLHSLAPLLGMLQNQGRKVALVTDGRLSGASGKFPAAIHVTPEASRGGALARLQEGDLITVDGTTGQLQVHLEPSALAARPLATSTAEVGHGMGRNLFAFNRALVGRADQGALSIAVGPLLGNGQAWEWDSPYPQGNPA